ncbi:MAG: hypothetical protein ABIE55_03845 [Candidatus Aenigmatarchaeota archaeon]
MKKLVLSFLVLSIILTQVAFAQDFNIVVEPSDLSHYDFFASHTAYITVTINNPMPEDWFSIIVFGFPNEWVVAKESLVKIPSYSSKTVLLEVKPARDAIPQEKEYLLKITRPSTGSVLEQAMRINIKQVTSAIIRDISLSCETCSDEVIVSGDALNVGSKSLTNLAVIVKVANQQKTFPINRLGVLESKDFALSFSLDGLSPEEYDVDFNLVNDVGMSFYKETKTLNIPSFENVIYDEEVSTTPFGSSVTVTATNTGNVVAEADLQSVSTEGWHYFISGPTPTGMMLGSYFWKVSLAPNESRSITYSEIYWPTYVLIISAVMIAVFIYWQSTALVFSKRLIRKSGKEVSVSLHLKSKKRGVGNVVVKDSVPADFSIVSKFESVKPLIRKVASGVELHWKLGSLSPHEERVLHYTLKPARELFKDVKLPSAKAKGVRRKAPIYKRSNRVSIHPKKRAKGFVTVSVKE